MTSNLRFSNNQQRCHYTIYLQLWGCSCLRSSSPGEHVPVGSARSSKGTCTCRSAQQPQIDSTACGDGREASYIARGYLPRILRTDPNLTPSTCMMKHVTAIFSGPTDKKIKMADKYMYIQGMVGICTYKVMTSLTRLQI